MSEKCLFFLEVFVDRITFIGPKSPPSNASDISISFEIRKFIRLDIFPLNLTNLKITQEIAFNCGKSALFSCDPENLKKQIASNQILMQLQLDNVPKAACQVSWPVAFTKFVQEVITSKGRKNDPARSREMFKLLAIEDNAPMAEVAVFVKLSAFGNAVHSNFQKLDKDHEQKFLVRGAKGITTFECEKLVEELPPVSASVSVDSKSMMDDSNVVLPPGMNLDWLALLQEGNENDMGKRFSELFGPSHKMSVQNDNLELDITFKTNPKGFVIEVTPSKEAGGGAQNAPPGNELTLLTVKEINEKICKHHDCPAVKKFKEFGIGPLARHPTSVHHTPAVPADHIRQIYREFNNSGPYFMYLRPRNPELPFVSKRADDIWREKCWKPKRPDPYWEATFNK